MAVINLLKNGTVIDDMSTITVPNTLIESIERIIERHQAEQQRSETK